MQLKEKRKRRQVQMFQDGSSGAKLIALRNEFSEFNPTIGGMNVVDTLDEVISELFVFECILEDSHNILDQTQQ